MVIKYDFINKNKLRMKTLQEITQSSIASKTNSAYRDILAQMRIPKILKRGIICGIIKRLLFKCTLCGHNIIFIHLHRFRYCMGWSKTKVYCSRCYKQDETNRKKHSTEYITVGPLDEVVTEKNFSKFIKCRHCVQNYVRLINGFRWKCFNCSAINIWSKLTRDNNIIFQYTYDPSLMRPLYHITINAVFEDDRVEKIETINTRDTLHFLFRLHYITNRYNVVYIINGSKFHDVSEDILTVDDILPYGIKNNSELTLYDEDNDIIKLIFNVKILISRHTMDINVPPIQPHVSGD